MNKLQNTKSYQDSKTNALNSIDTNCRSQMSTLLDAGDVLFDFFNRNSYIIVVASDGTIMKIWDAPQLPFGLKVNNPVPEGTVTHRALITKKRCTSIMSKEKSRFGFGYVGVSLPCFDAKGVLIGVITITTPLNQQDTVLEISKELKNDISISNENKKNISSISDEIVNIVNTLSNISSEIHKNIGVITDVINLIQNVSGQTNLLGLNAAIESARVGEAGRGFTVVAQEIRKLSETVKDSVKELNNKLTALNKMIEDINPQVVSLNALVSKQAVSIQEIDEITGRLDKASERLGALAQEAWV